MALKETTKEAIYLANMFNLLNIELDLGYINSIPTILVNSKLAKKLAENLEFHKRSKYIEIIYYFIRQAILEGKVVINQIPSKYMLADFLTKNINNVLYKALIDLAKLDTI